MVDENHPTDEFPPPGFPVVYADGAISIAPSGTVTKFYLARVDPNMYGRGGVSVNPIAQVVMPTVGFLRMVDFLKEEAERIKQTHGIPWPPDDVRKSEPSDSEG